MTEPQSYRALPVDLSATNEDAVATAFGAVEIEGALVSEIREYSGGELVVALEPEGDWEVAGEAVGGAELWLYGVRRLEIVGGADFLQRPQSLTALELANGFDIRFDSGSVTGEVSHAVLRVWVI